MFHALSTNVYFTIFFHLHIFCNPDTLLWMFFCFFCSPFVYVAGVTSSRETESERKNQYWCYFDHNDIRYINLLCHMKLGESLWFNKHIYSAVVMSAAILRCKPINNKRLLRCCKIPKHHGSLWEVTKDCRLVADIPVLCGVTSGPGWQLVAAPLQEEDQKPGGHLALSFSLSWESLCRLQTFLQYFTVQLRTAATVLSHLLLCCFDFLLWKTINATFFWHQQH